MPRVFLLINRINRENVVYWIKKTSLPARQIFFNPAQEIKSPLGDLLNSGVKETDGQNAYERTEKALDPVDNPINAALFAGHGPGSSFLRR